MEGYIPPKLDQNCQCICHKQPGVMHVVACCRESEPQMTPTPTLQAAAMRTAAAALCDREHAGAYWGRAILALPLEADHNALLAEVVKMPEIAQAKAALNEADMMLDDGGFRNTRIHKIVKAALKALETP